MIDIPVNDIVAIATEAGAFALSRMDQDYGRWEKEPGNPVSEIDLAVDRMLFERLMPLIPGVGWLSEETIDDPVRLAAERVWVVDPIDGTRDFLRQRRGWAVSVALVENGQPVLGVLHAPVRNELWIAVKGQGATLNGAPIHVSDRTELAGARVPAHMLPSVDSDLVLVEQPNSIALRLAMVAAGDADLVATLRWGHEWDVAAAVLLVREAGGVVTDAFGQSLGFNAPDPKAFGLIGCAPGIHEAAIERLAERVAASISAD